MIQRTVPRMKEGAEVAPPLLVTQRVGGGVELAIHPRVVACHHRVVLDDVHDRGAYAAWPTASTRDARRGHVCQRPWVYPPSTSSVVPVMNEARARNSAASDVSDTSPTRPSGWIVAKASGSSMSGVRMMPGASVFTRIP